MNDEPANHDLADALRATLGKLKRRLRERSQAGDLTGSQSAVLSRLDREGPATVTALARAEGMRPQSMGANLSALAALGLVDTAPHPSDGRQTLYRLTPACRARVQQARSAQRDWLAGALDSQLSAAERRQLAEAVVLLGRLADA